MQALYARKAARYPSFHEPQLGWWRRRRVPMADKADEGELSVLEDRLGLEEIAHFRAGADPKMDFLCKLDYWCSQTVNGCEYPGLTDKSVLISRKS